MSKQVKKDQRSKRRFLLIFGASFVILSSCIVAVLIVRPHVGVWWSQFKIISSRRHDIQPQITVTPDFLRPEVEKILAHKSLPNISLSKLAQVIQNQLSAKRVSVIKTRPFHYLIKITLRRPVLKIIRESNKSPLFISEEAKLYKPFKPQDNELTSLEGLDLPAQLVFNNQAEVLLDQEQKIAVEQAVNLVGELKQKNISLQKIVYQKYRGFTFYLKPHGQEIIIGDAPFTAKLEKLKTIFTKVNPLSIARVELDYNGKAFIKYAVQN